MRGVTIIAYRIRVEETAKSQLINQSSSFSNEKKPLRLPLVSREILEPKKDLLEYRNPRVLTSIIAAPHQKEGLLGYTKGSKIDPFKIKIKFKNWKKNLEKKWTKRKVGFTHSYDRSLNKQTRSRTAGHPQDLILLGQASQFLSAEEKRA